MSLRIKKRLKKIMKSPPLPFQVDGVRFLRRNNGRGIIGDDMGLGKTYQAIAWLALNPEKRPVVIICPATLKYQWKSELKRHARFSSTIISGRAGHLPKEKIYIINYDILSNRLKQLIKLKPSVIIMDESHYVKNMRAARTKACKKFCKKIPHVIALSGTPITNCPAEFFPVLNMIAPKTFSSFWKYAFQYCDPKPGWAGKGWDFSGASNLPELKEKIQPFLIRRMKTEVLKDLPPKRRIYLPVEINNMIEYSRASKDFLNWVEENGGMDAVKRAMRAMALVQLGKLKHLAAKGKLTTAGEWIKDFREQTKKKLVVFAIHDDIVKGLKLQFREALIIDGKTSVEQRADIVKKFQEIPTSWLLLAKIRAAGVGLTLTAASDVLFVEIGWTPAEMAQAEDRVLRIGQMADSVNCWYMMAKDTVEDKVFNAIRRKKRVLKTLLGGNQ